MQQYHMELLHVPGTVMMCSGAAVRRSGLQQGGVNQADVKQVAGSDTGCTNGQQLFNRLELQQQRRVQESCFGAAYVIPPSLYQ